MERERDLEEVRGASTSLAALVPVPPDPHFQTIPVVCLLTFSPSRVSASRSSRTLPAPPHDGGAGGPRSLRRGQENLRWRPLRRQGWARHEWGASRRRGKGGGRRGRGFRGRRPPLCPAARPGVPRAEIYPLLPPQTGRAADSSPLGSSSPNEASSGRVQTPPKGRCGRQAPLASKFPDPTHRLEQTPPEAPRLSSRNFGGGGRCPPRRGGTTHRGGQPGETRVPDVRGGGLQTTAEEASAPGPESRCAPAPTRPSVFAARLAELAACAAAREARDPWCALQCGEEAGGGVGGGRGPGGGGGVPEEGEGKGSRETGPGGGGGVRGGGGDLTGGGGVREEGERTRRSGAG